MRDRERIRKLLQLAGDNPQTPEQRTAYAKAQRLLEKRKKWGPVKFLPAPSPNEEPLAAPRSPEKSQKRLPAPVPTAWERLRNWLGTKIESVPWDQLYQREPDEYDVYEVIPTPSVRNNQTAVLAKVITTFYRKPSELRVWGEGALLKKKQQARCSFRIVMKAGEISFYLLLPRDRAGELLRKAEAIYDSGITIRKVEALPRLNPAQVFCTELGYRKHDMFSLDSNHSNNWPLPSLLTTVRTLEGGDVAVFDALLEPYSYAEWYKEAKRTHAMLEKGQVPGVGHGGALLRLVSTAFQQARRQIIEATRRTKEEKEAWRNQLKEESRYQEAARIRQEMTPATKRKAGDEVLKVWLRIAVQSDDPERARQAAYTMANAWKDISGDNDLERHDVPAKWTEKYLEGIETRKGFSIRLRANKMSVDEVGKLLQLPGRELIEEFPQIQARKLKDIDLPGEITREDVKRVRIGYVTVRGKRYLVGQPLKGWKGGPSRAAVYDALCTFTFGQGKQGSGKSDGFGAVWCYDMVMAGFTAILIDTADGQVLRNFVNSLPADYPEEKLHLLNLDNKAWPVPLGWDDVYGREFASAEGDEELTALEISERLTSRFVWFINRLSATGEFTDRMKQYVVSCMRAITTASGWSFLDLELALTSISYRKELLERPEVGKMPEVAADLLDLQEKAYEGKEKAITGPILSRVRALAATPFLENMFYQPPKREEDGKPVLDFRRLMDNPEGGYGHVVCVQASPDAWQGYQGVILGFMDDKINFNVYSRVDVDQSKRKPCIKWVDEPSRIREFLEDELEKTATEFRKYRVKQLMTNHSIDQMGKAANAVLDGGAQITSYKTERLSEISKHLHRFKPYTKAQELYDALPEKHVAVNAVRLPSGETCPAFIAEMVAPPKKVKDRSAAWQRCAEKYGRPWKAVRQTIQEKRLRYQTEDREMLEEFEERQKAAKEAEKAAKEAEKKAKATQSRKKAN